MCYLIELLYSNQNHFFLAPHYCMRKSLSNQSSSAGGMAGFLGLCPRTPLGPPEIPHLGQRNRSLADTAYLSDSADTVAYACQHRNL